MASTQTVDSIHQGGPEPQTFWISPTLPIKAQTIDLPSCDQIGVTVIQPLVLCFQTTEHFNEQSFINGVKAASAAVITEIPAFAGKLEWEDEARHRIKCTIPENPKIQVRIKWHPHLNGAHLDAEHWPPHYFKHAEVCLAPRPTFGIGTYNFGVQANIVAGGAVMIVLHMNHTIADGSGQSVIWRIFAHHLGRSMDGEAPTSSGIVPAQALDKSRAYGTHPARSMLEWKDWKAAPENTMSAEAATAAFLEKMAKLAYTVWHIPPEKLTKMRNKMQDPSKPRLSTATCLSTWLWRIVTRARHLSPATITRMLTPIQTRGRVKEMHANYSGSALVYGRAKAAVSELPNVSTHDLAHRISEGVAWWTPSRIREFWGTIENCDDLAKYRPNTDRDFGTDLELSNIMNLSFYDLNWGRGLRPRAWRLPGIAFTDAWVIVNPRLPSGGLELQCWFARDTLMEMCKDPEFGEYAEFWGAHELGVDRHVAEAMPPTHARL